MRPIREWFPNGFGPSVPAPPFRWFRAGRRAPAHRSHTADDSGRKLHRSWRATLAQPTIRYSIGSFSRLELRIAILILGVSPSPIISHGTKRKENDDGKPGQQAGIFAPIHIPTLLLEDDLRIKALTKRQLLQTSTCPHSQLHKEPRDEPASSDSIVFERH